jgi:hypothetical protein
MFLALQFFFFVYTYHPFPSSTLPLRVSVGRIGTTHPPIHGLMLSYDFFNARARCFFFRLLILLGYLAVFRFHLFVHLVWE